MKLLQIWVLPKERNIIPRYDQKIFLPEERKNKIQTIVSPEKLEGTLWINQDAYFSLSDLSAAQQLDYTVKRNGNGVYIFVIDGSIEVVGEKLDIRDGIGISNIDNLEIKALSVASLLIMEVPMN